MVRRGRDLVILASGALPALVLGVAWMRQAGIPAAVYLQNVAAAIVGGAIAAYGMRRRASPKAGRALTMGAVVLLLATLVAEGVQGVHRWIRIGPLTLHVASLVIPVVLVELDRLLRDVRLAVAFAVLLTVGAILAIQPDAAQATAFAGAGVVLLAVHRRYLSILALLALAGLSFLRSDPVAPVAHVEEIAMRIGQQGAVWAAVVVITLILLSVPFLATATPAGVALAVYLALCIAASWWGHFPVPVLGYGMSPILGYFTGWAWLQGPNSNRVSPLHR